MTHLLHCDYIVPRPLPLLLPPFPTLPLSFNISLTNQRRTCNSVIPLPCVDTVIRFVYCDNCGASSLSTQAWHSWSMRVLQSRSFLSSLTNNTIHIIVTILHGVHTYCNIPVVFLLLMYIYSLFSLLFLSRVNCPFYFKIGACRHGDKCSRLHNKPLFSQTVLIKVRYTFNIAWW